MSKIFGFQLDVRGSNSENFFNVFKSEAIDLGWECECPIYKKMFPLTTTNDEIITEISTLISECHLLYSCEIDVDMNFILHWNP